MRVHNSTAHTTLEQKDGKTYAVVIVSVLTECGHTREVELTIPTAVEDWDKANIDKEIIDKFKVDTTYWPQGADPVYR
jgi:hypothetical protein